MRYDYGQWQEILFNDNSVFTGLFRLQIYSAELSLPLVKGIIRNISGHVQK